MEKMRKVENSALIAQLQPRLIRASAGTGKTFELAKRYLTLLVAGEQPERILATTFTRKAAGEIRERIYRVLATEVLYSQSGIGIEGLDSEKAGRLLQKLVQQQHRLNICTLDSFFMRLASSFSMEMDLPPGWRISDEAVNQEIISESVAALLHFSGSSRLRILLRLLSRGEAPRAVQDRLIREIPQLHELFRSSTSAAWRRFSPPVAPVRESIELALDQLEQIQLSKAKRVQGAIRDNLQSFKDEDWQSFVAKGIVKPILAGKEEYNGCPIDSEVRACFQVLIAECRAVQLNRLYQQTVATYLLLKLYDRAYRALRRQGRTVSFDDLKFILASNSFAGNLDQLYYRLDQRIAHLLLDEFQDTSAMQWQVIEPLADEILAKASGECSFFCVGDVKQAIYGWRGGVAEIFDSLEMRWPQLQAEPKDQSYRCAPAVLSAVNRVFSTLKTNTAIMSYHQAAEVWQSRFNLHKSVNERSPGYATVIQLPEADDEAATDLFHYVARVAKDLVESNQRITIGILCRSNKSVAKMIYKLSRPDIGLIASEEGGNPLTDSPAVMAAMALLKLIDHPGDRIAAFHVASSPLGTVVGLNDFCSPGELDKVISVWRRKILDDGYGTTISRLREGLRGYYSERDQRRLTQLVELTLLVEPELSLRCVDLIKRVEKTRVEDPTAARIRVMTVHQAKGLEFSAVLLPDLGAPLTGRSMDAVLTCRNTRLDPPWQILSNARKEVRQLEPILQRMHNDNMSDRVLEALSVLYVAMTRARHALYMFCGVAETRSESFAKLIKEALLVDGEYESGDPRWWEKLAYTSNCLEEKEDFSNVQLDQPCLMVDDRNVWRSVPRQTASGMQSQGRVRPGQLFDIRSSDRASYGILVHACFEMVGWLHEEETPDADRLFNFLKTRFPRKGKSELLEAVEGFRSCLLRPEIRSFFNYQHYDYLHADQLKVIREYQFVLRQKRTIVTGACDRVVVAVSAGSPCAAEVVDFKTDRIMIDGSNLATKIADYAPQMEVYRQAISRLTGLAKDKITVKLLFVEAGVAASV